MRRLTPVLLLFCLLQVLPPLAQGQLLQNSGMQGDHVSFREGEKSIRVPAAAEAAVAAHSAPYVAPQQAGDEDSLVHVVRPGDTIDSIAVTYGLTRDELLALNPNITNPRIISIGQEIIVRRDESDAAPDDSAAEAPPAEEAASEREDRSGPETRAGDSERGARRAISSGLGANLAPAPVSIAALPAMDPLAMRASVCVTLFDDVNRNRLREPGEVPLANGLLLLSGADSEARMATSPEASCFEELAGGAWVLQVDAPEGYGLTAPGQLQLGLPSGARLDIAVGAAAGLQPVEPPPPDEVHVFSEDVTQDTSAPPLEVLFGNIGYVAFGLAGLLLIAGSALTLSLRRR